MIDTQLHRYEEVDIVLYKNDLREFMGSLYKKCESVIESDSKDVLDLLYFPCERRNCADINNGAKIYSKLIEGLL